MISKLLEDAKKKKRTQAERVKRNHLFCEHESKTTFRA